MVLLPPVRRNVNRSHDVAGAAVFAAGCVAGGLTVAAPLAVAAGLTAAVAPGARAIALSAVLVYLGLLESGHAGPRPEGRQQLIAPARLRRSLLRGLLAFGFELGVGFRTRITHMSPLVLIAVLLLGAVGLPGFALAAVGWGLGRASAFVVRLAQRPVIGGLVGGQDAGERSAERFERIMQVASTAATQALFGGAFGLAAHGLLSAW